MRVVIRVWVRVRVSIKVRVRVGSCRQPTAVVEANTMRLRRDRMRERGMVRGQKMGVG